MISGIEDKKNEETLEIVKEQLKTKYKIKKTYLTEAIRERKLLDHKHRLIHVNVSRKEHKLDKLCKSPRLKGTRIFINEYLIQEEKFELRKEVRKVKEERKAGKWEIIKNMKFIIIDKVSSTNDK